MHDQLLRMATGATVEEVPLFKMFIEKMDTGEYPNLFALAGTRSKAPPVLVQALLQGAPGPGPRPWSKLWSKALVQALVQSARAWS